MRTLPRHTKALHSAIEEGRACADSESVDSGVSRVRKRGGRGCCRCCYYCCGGRDQSKAGNEGLRHSHAHCYPDPVLVPPQSKCPNRKRHLADPIRCSPPTEHAFCSKDFFPWIFFCLLSVLSLTRLINLPQYKLRQVGHSDSEKESAKYRNLDMTN